MNPLKKLLLVTLLTGMTVSSPVQAYSPDEDSLLLEIGKLIGGALRGEAPPPQDAPVAMEVFGDAAAGAAGAAPGEKEREEFNSRIEAYSNAMQAWVIKSCNLSEEQQTHVGEVFVKIAESRKKAFAEKRKANQRNEYLPATFPVTFTTGDEAPGTAFSTAVVASLKKDILTGEQFEQLNAALKERKTFHNQAYISYLVSLIDAELFLTGEQRMRLTRQMSESKPAVASPLYSFQPQSYYLPYESLSGLISQASIKDILEPTQKKRLQDLISTDQNSQHIVFQAAEGIENWGNQLNEMSIKQREQFLRAAAVRVTWYEKELHLAPDQVEYLNNAGKGATIRALGDWKENTRQTFDQMEQQMAQMGGNFGFSAQNIDTRSIDKNEIWADAVRSIIKDAPADNLNARSSADQKAMAGSVLSLLDAELWLLPEQRALLLPMIEKSMPQDSSQMSYQEYIRDVILLAHPLFRVPEKSRAEILTEPQLAAWKQLESLFQYQKGNNYVQIQLRNNGGSFGFSLGQ